MLITIECDCISIPEEATKDWSTGDSSRPTLTTNNVNGMVNRSHDQQQSVVISKDAKAIILADIAPVRHPSHSCKPRELPDHTWDQSRTNALTFLFLKEYSSETVSVDGDCIK